MSNDGSKNKNGRRRRKAYEAAQELGCLFRNLVLLIQVTTVRKPFFFIKSLFRKLAEVTTARGPYYSHLVTIDTCSGYLKSSSRFLDENPSPRPLNPKLLNRSHFGSSCASLELKARWSLHTQT